MAIQSKSDFLSGLAVGMAISEGGGGGGSGGGKRCPRAEPEVTWSWADIITEEMTWTATAAEYTE